VIKFASGSDMRQVCGFLRVIKFASGSDMRQVCGFLITISSCVVLDLYDGLMSSALKEDLLVQSWIELTNSPGDKLPSNCTIRPLVARVGSSNETQVGNLVTPNLTIKVYFRHTFII
jgi:hypothetical protein